MTLENNIAALARYFGWYSACKGPQGPQQPPPSLFWLLDGSAVMDYFAHLIHDRSLVPNSIVAAAYSLRSGLRWLAAEGARAAPGGLFASEEDVAGLGGGGVDGGYMVSEAVESRLCLLACLLASAFASHRQQHHNRRRMHSLTP